MSVCVDLDERTKCARAVGVCLGRGGIDPEHQCIGSERARRLTFVGDIHVALARTMGNATEALHERKFAARRVHGVERRGLFGVKPVIDLRLLNALLTSLERAADGTADNETTCDGKIVGVSCANSI